MSCDITLVGLTGFEPATPCPPDKCANQAALQPVGISEWRAYPLVVARRSTFGEHLVDTIGASRAKNLARALTDAHFDDSNRPVVERAGADVSRILEQCRIEFVGRIGDVQAAEIRGHRGFVEFGLRIVATADRD